MPVGSLTDSGRCTLHRACSHVGASSVHYAVARGHRCALPNGRLEGAQVKSANALRIRAGLIHEALGSPSRYHALHRTAEAVLPEYYGGLCRLLGWPIMGACPLKVGYRTRWCLVVGFTKDCTMVIYLSSLNKLSAGWP
jgi:hypothetical protein